MALYATNRFAGDGTTTQYEFNFVGKYINRAHVKVYQEDNVTKARTYVSINDSNFLNDTTLRGLPVTRVGSTLVIYRETPKPPLVNFVNGSRFTEYNMDLVARQGLFVAMEALDAGGIEALQQLRDAIAVVAGLVDAATAAVSDATAVALATQTALDSFDDRYLGQKPADPANDNDGGALLVGALYFRTTAPIGMKVWTGTAWDDAYANLSSKFDKTGGDIYGNVNLPSLNGGPLGGMRNRIINGCFRVAQRPAAVLAKNTIVYGGADRFFSYVSGFTTVSGQTAQQTTLNRAFSSSGFDQFMSLTTTGTGTIHHGTRLESKDVFDLSGKTITAKVNVYQDIGNVPVYLKLSKANAKDDFSVVTQVAQSAGSIPVGGTGTVTLTTTLGAADAANGLQVEVLMLNVGAVTNKNFAIAQFSLELGTVATPFEHRHYGQELALCQRYYEEVSYRVDTAVSSASIFGSVFIAYKATKRTLPTLVHKALNVNNCTFNSFQSASAQGCAPTYQPSSAGGVANATLVADAEL